jgi:hypothetical protein
MKKYVLALLVASAISGYAIGPKIVRGVLQFAPSTSTSTSGYWLYWRVPTAAFTDAQRHPIPATATEFDLRILSLPPGVYVFAMSATNLVESESILSNEMTWDATVPNKPVLVDIRK